MTKANSSSITRREGDAATLPTSRHAIFSDAFVGLEPKICDLRNMAQIAWQTSVNSFGSTQGLDEQGERDANATLFAISHTADLAAELEHIYHAAWPSAHGVEPVDPVYAAIDKHRAAWKNFGGESNEELNRTGDIARAAIKKLIATKPTTSEGAFALAMYYRQFFAAEREKAEAQGLSFDDVESCGAGLGLIPDVWPFALLETLAEYFKPASEEARP